MMTFGRTSKSAKLGRHKVLKEAGGGQEEGGRGILEQRENKQRTVLGMGERGTKVRAGARPHSLGSGDDSSGLAYTSQYPLYHWHTGEGFGLPAGRSLPMLLQVLYNTSS